MKETIVICVYLVLFAANALVSAVGIYMCLARLWGSR